MLSTRSIPFSFWTCLVLSLSVILAGVLGIGASACGGNQREGVTPVALDVPVGSDAGATHARASTPAAVANDFDKNARVPVTSDDPVRGVATAPVTIVVFSDFQCPFCLRGEERLTQVLDTYAGKVRVVWKHEPLPFHDKARPSARMAHALFYRYGNDAFWAFHDQVFRNQRDLDDESLKRYAQSVVKGSFEVSREEFTKAEAKIDADHELAQKLDVRGTPAFFINGVRLSGAQPFERFQSIVDAQLEAAAILEKTGVPRDRIYATLTHKNFAEPEREEDRDAEIAAERARQATEVSYVPVGTSPTRGPADAPVTIVVFSDFQCPYCGRIEGTFRQITQTYGSKVRFVWKNEPLPFHNRAKPAAHLALEIRAQKGNEGFWKAHDKLFEEQKNLDDATFELIAKELKADVSKVMAAVKAEKHQKVIDEDLALGEDVRASGTPHMFINGRRLIGAKPFDAFQTLIDEELVKAEALVKKGTAKAKVYDTIMAAAKTASVRVIPIGPKAPVRGAATTKITVHMFGDFADSFSAKTLPIISDLMKKNPSMKLVWHDYARASTASTLPAQAAREAYAQKGNDGFWKMHDKLFARRDVPGGLDRAALDSYAQELGLDTTKWKDALDQQVHRALIEEDAATAKGAGIVTSPSFVINGRLVEGAQPIEKYQRAIDRSLAP